MTQTIRLFMLFEGASFVAASLIHSGVFIAGYEHSQARVAEGVIAAVLIAGLVLSFVRRAWTRWVGLAAQGFALLGTLVGLFTIAIGIGPRTAPDLVYHATILAVLVWGLIVTARAGSQRAGWRA
ncbi:MAG: hypothetical protein M5U01_16830 [Ardenticatenaceae bacterium]|nr:hypothetical protein [Ardenticatenaceae bacterium]HBY95831.1 hypothetical protein [Chloroflexota bacterium]